MKCIKNKSNGNIIRVEDRVAYNMVGREWDYTSKSEWKSQFKKEVVEVKEEVAVVEETISEKQLKKKKNAR